MVWELCLSRLTLKISVVGETESLLTAILLSDDASSSDCANAGRADAASRNNSEKLKPAIDRVNNWLKRIDRFLPGSNVRAAREPRPHPVNLSSAG